MMRNIPLLIWIIGLMTISKPAQADCTLAGSPNNSSGNPLSGCSGIVTITGTLTMNAGYNLSGSGITQIVITNTGSIVWSSNVSLVLPAGCSIVIDPGSVGLTYTGPCSAAKRVFFGSLMIAACLGGAAEYTFGQVNANGGITGVLSASASSNSPVCPGGTLNLSVTYSGGIAPYTFSWTGPGGFSSTDQNPSTSAVAGTYTCTVTEGSGDTQSPSTIVTVGTTPSAPSGTGGSRCGTGTVNISASVGVGETVDWYDVASGGTVLAGGTGTTTFTTPSISSTTTYYAETRNTTTGCLSATRTAVIATVEVPVVPSITITAAYTNLCSSGINFSSSISNGGGGPTYQWILNSVNIPAATSSTYTLTNYNNGDIIECLLTSSESCAIPNPATSNAININIPPQTTTWQGTSSSVWSSSLNWSNGIPSPDKSAIIPSGTPNNPTIATTASVFNLTLESGATLTISGVNILNVYGDFTIDGTFVPNFGTINFRDCVGFTGATDHEVTSATSTTISLYNVTLDDPNGLTLNTDAEIRGGLTLTEGNFNNNGNTFTFISDASETAFINEIQPAASYTGNITLQRFAPGPITGWAHLGTPINGNTLAGWQDDFTTSGFPGSTGWAGGFKSIWTYDETDVGTFDSPTSYVAATDITNPTPVGTGFWVFLGDGLNTTNDITIDVTGVPHTGDFNFNPTFTSSGSLPDDGYNLLANPYPCAIDWDDADWTKVNVNNAVYIYQADLGQYASYVGGVGTNGGSNLIAHSQGFYIQTSASSPQLIAGEDCKTTSNPTLIRKTDPANTLRLRIAANESTDEAVIRFTTGATIGYDGSFDAKKFISPDATHPASYSLIDGHKYSINALPLEAGSYEIPFNIEVSGNEQIEILVSGLERFTNGSCFTITDHEFGTTYNLDEGKPVMVGPSGAKSASARFTIHARIAPEVQVEKPTCSNSHNGAIRSAFPVKTNNNVSLKRKDGRIIQTIPAEQFNKFGFQELFQGEYILDLGSSATCGSSSTLITIEPRTSINTSVSSKILSNGDVALTSGEEHFDELIWNTGDGTILSGFQTIEHRFESEGNYTVGLYISKEGCSESVEKTLTITERSAAIEDAASFILNSGEWYIQLNKQNQDASTLKLFLPNGQLLEEPILIPAGQQLVKVPVPAETIHVMIAELSYRNSAIRKTLLR